LRVFRIKVNISAPLFTLTKTRLKVHTLCLVPDGEKGIGVQGAEKVTSFSGDGSQEMPWKPYEERAAG
jgi:hypothetical protein